MVEVEFCSNCEAHLYTVRHQEDKYHQQYELLKRGLEAEGVRVRRKAPPSHLYKKSPYCPPNVYYVQSSSEMVFYPAVGSFEVYLMGNKIHSKLDSRRWPTIQNIIKQIK